TEKFFAVILVDADTPAPDQGLTLLGPLRERSPNTSLIVMAPRRSFEVAVKAFRGGADDVVVKTPDQVDYLRSRVLGMAGGKQRKADDRRLMTQTRDMHEELMT